MLSTSTAHKPSGSIEASIFFRSSNQFDRRRTLHKTPFRVIPKDLQNYTGHPKTEPTLAVAKKSQTEGFGSVSVFASGVTGSFWFHCFPVQDRISSSREGERGGKREGE